MAVSDGPEVSVIMPAHNAHEFIADSVRSVLLQSFTDFELIICDDGSTDATKQIIKACCESDARVVFVENTNAQGAGAARNKCIDESRGEYIAFLDADDIWHPSKLEKQIEFLKKEKADFVFSHYSTFRDCASENDAGRVIDSHWLGRVRYADLLWKRINLGCLTVLCRSSLIQSNRMSDIRSGQDYAFWLLLLRGTDHAYCFPEVTAYYRTGHSSLSANKLKKIKNMFLIFKNQELNSILYSTILCVNYVLMTMVLSVRSKLATARIKRKLLGS